MKLRFTIRWMKMVKIYFQGSSQNSEHFETISHFLILTTDY